MKKTKTLLMGVLLTMICSTTVQATPIVANNKQMPSIQQQMNDFKAYDARIKGKQIKIQQDKTTNGVSTYATTTGSYPTRKGTILVTDGLRTDSLVGHAGMVLSSGKTIESFPDGGVQYYYYNWTTKYKKVWGVTVEGTSITQDAQAADWAVLQKGDPYNWNFFDTENLNKFYCSQLVYKAFKTKTGIDLNYLGGAVTPADLVNTSKTYNIYTYSN